MPVHFVRLDFLLFVYLVFQLNSTTALASSNIPVVFYTDITSGPNTGGENNNGIFISIFGRNFGNDISKIHVYLNDAEVAAYNYLGPSLGRSDIQQLTIQPGPKTKSGTLNVVVDGQSAIDRLPFYVRSGLIYFVSLEGNDEKGKAANLRTPYRHVQSIFDDPDYGPGDFIVLRGGDWRDVGRYKAFLTVYNKSGTLAKPLSIVGYPGEKVVIDSTGHRGGFNFYKSHGGVTLSGLRINGNGHDVIQMQAKTNNMRIVNNEVYGLWKKSGGSAGIVGNGKNWSIFGNSIHDNGYSKLFHGIYIDNDNGDGSENIEIAYNHIFRQTGGRGIQVYWRSPPMINIFIHDNLIHDIDRDGILISDNAGDGIRIFNNVIYRTGLVDGSAIRINSKIARVEIENNTIFDASVARTVGNLYFENAAAISMYNNIIYAIDRQPYVTLEVPLSRIHSSNNLWYGAGHAPAFDLHSVQRNPLFANLRRYDFHINNHSPAIDIGRDIPIRVITDFDGTKRHGKAVDAGAFEYVPPAGLPISTRQSSHSTGPQ